MELNKTEYYLALTTQPQKQQVNLNYMVYILIILEQKQILLVHIQEALEFIMLAV